MMQPCSLVWFRHDLRVFDHSALQAAVRRGLPVVGVFVAESPAGGQMADGGRRAEFVHQCVRDLQRSLAQHGVPLFVLTGSADKVLPEFAVYCGAEAVFFGEEDEPEARTRDGRTAARLTAHRIAFHAVRGQSVFARSDLLTPDGRPYTAFSAYREAWLARFDAEYGTWRVQDDWAALYELQKRLPDRLRRAPPLPSAGGGGLLPLAGGEAAAQTALAGFLPHLAGYAQNRDFPARKGASQLSVYLRYGTLSVRHTAGLIRQADGGSIWLDGLIRREFFRQFFYHVPDKAGGYAGAGQERHSAGLVRWRNGETGYPLVDAAMRHLVQTGMMHHRLRQLCASFLVHGLLIDWRAGADWFACQLLDFDRAANTGNWRRVAAGLPAFRPPDPVLQSRKIDPDGRFIRRHLPQLAHLDKNTVHAPWTVKNGINTFGYPPPLIDYAGQRAKAEMRLRAAKEVSR
ncbi:deoxyribodipyrimidine photo-lyase [Neisseria leonii]|uniref:cryptochrome/photolyase family protein n=1 Tax=Neisseria leonii TaxID=2995413 RepID=UPI0030CEB106